MLGMVEPRASSFAGMGSALASLMFLWAVVSRYFPNHLLDAHLSKYTHKLLSLVYPYITIRFPEHAGERLKRSEAYVAIESYLTSICTATATKLKADIGKDSTKLSLSMDDHEEVTDDYKGVRVWWASGVTPVKSQTFPYFGTPDEKRYYQLTYHRRYRDLINDHYLPHVMEEGRAAGVRRRQRKLYTNNPTSSPYSPLWSHVPFDHPATFETIGMDPEKKREIMQDLQTFSRSKEYYRKIGKAWKRGYLLYGPPGTGKSSMVAAMANFLDYDVYDVELTAVSNNTALRKLLIETSSKSLIVIEDIDCSLDLTGKRKRKKDGEGDGGDDKEGRPPMAPEEEERKDSKVTLSGLLNFIDGLWSACGGERLIVFTTNYVEKLDPALIRRGRMDMQVELSYCGFEAFRVLGRNYLGVESHRLYDRVEELIGEVRITPADVAELLMPKAQAGTEEEVTGCIEGLIRAMEEIKAKAAKEAEEAAAAAAKVEEEEERKLREEREVKEDAVATAAAHSTTAITGCKENGVVKEEERP